MHSVGKILTLLVIVFGLLFGGISSLSQDDAKPRQPPAKPEKPAGAVQSAQAGRYTVVGVADGDTIKVDHGGTIETVRLIGINTPESVDPRRAVQCFGVEASNHTKQLLSGKTVLLESDDSQGNRDKYGRLLRYVLLEDGSNFNRQLVAEGFAYEYTYDGPYKYQQEFKQAQAEASAAGKGLWAAGTCAGQPSPAGSAPLPTVPRSSNVPVQPSGNCVIKGNINADGEKIYHVPGGRYYQPTRIDAAKGERFFCSEAEAISAGWRKSGV